jgi:hypothetical protein
VGDECKRPDGKLQLGIPGDPWFYLPGYPGNGINFLEAGLVLIPFAD